ncbi:MAG TPA: alpha/beta fold hydrolase [Phototrophicaceae bacterium]|nr:alpha/beta fold hydrolase [Phototrophicaceae bacterium]
MLKVLSLFVVLALLVSGAAAQDTPAIAPQGIEIEAADDLILVGDFYVQPDESAHPTIFLMHQLNSNRHSWSTLIPALLEAGYNVLAIDLRGHGDTKGAKDWPAATVDVQTWLDWLREQPNVQGDSIAIIGASIGSNLALVGCANDETCVTAIALSPGLDYFGVKPETAITDGLRKRSALLVAAQSDMESANGVKQMAAAAKGDIGLRLYPGASHGTSLLSSAKTATSLTTLILDWLNEHLPQA